VLLRFFRFSVLAFEISKRHIQRFVTEPDANRVYRNAFFVQRVGIRFAIAVELGLFDLGFLRNCLQPAQESPSSTNR